MKQIILITILIMSSNLLYGQVRGNGKIASISKNVSQLKSIDIQFNADIILDYNIDETMTITTDENLLALIGIQFLNGSLVIDQKEWIEPSIFPQITIGCPNLVNVYQGTHSKTVIKNINGAILNIEGNVGDVIGEGSIKNLNINTTGTDIDLSELSVVNANITIDDDSKVIIKEIVNLKTNLDEDARLQVINQSKEQKKNTKKSKLYAEPNPDLRFIKFKIKNNSWKRNHFVVVGPKRDGRKFSYGFSMFPGTTRDENWSVGTKVYEETRNGGRSLLVTIKESDEASTVELYK